MVAALATHRFPQGFIPSTRPPSIYNPVRFPFWGLQPNIIRNKQLLRHFLIVIRLSYRVEPTTMNGGRVRLRHSVLDIDAER